MKTNNINITIQNDISWIKQLYCEIMAAVSFFKYLREQRDRKININITLE